MHCASIAICDCWYVYGYHGPDGIYQIAKTVHDKTKNLASLLKENGFDIKHDQFFDTIRFGVNGKNINLEKLKANLRTYENGDIGISIDETTSQNDINELLKFFKCNKDSKDNYSLKETDHPST